MRMIFGVLSLLVVLAIVGSLAKKQLQAVNGGMTTRAATAASQAQATAAGEPDLRRGSTVAVPCGMAGAMAADVGGLTVPQQSKALQDKVRDDTVRALQQGADRNKRADER
ncbi:MAG: hypothetical protein ABIO71_14440 [Caldimonas sp.]